MCSSDLVVLGDIGHHGQAGGKARVLLRPQVLVGPRALVGDGALGDELVLPVAPAGDVEGGAGNARNKSLERAVGRYIAFLDSDDLWYPEYLETMIGFMEEKNVELAYCSYSRCDEHTMEPILKDFKADNIVYQPLIDQY